MSGDELKSHVATVVPEAVRKSGLPLDVAVADSTPTPMIWALWTRYANLGSRPVGTRLAYENEVASHTVAA